MPIVRPAQGRKSRVAGGSGERGVIFKRCFQRLVRPLVLSDWLNGAVRASKQQGGQLWLNQ